MDTKNIKTEIRKKELKLGIKSLETSVERFELELLKLQLEEHRLTEELGKSSAALAEKQLELEGLQKEA
jgi:hypothetical protein